MSILTDIWKEGTEPAHMPDSCTGKRGVNDGGTKKLQSIRGCGVEFTAEGKMRPSWIRWTDGHIFQIDRIKQICRAASRKAGGVGLRYTVIISGQESQLYYEENYKWFVEAKHPQ